EGGVHTPETEQYGITSFVFRNQKPFHPERFWNYLNVEYPSGVIRAKGLFWLASRPDDAINFSQAGGSSRLERAGVWWVSMTFEERINYASFVENKDFIECRWDKKWGDRMNELVFIGQDIDKEKMTGDLENCLLNDQEILLFNKEHLFTDPFPMNI
ncbi:MAG: GTP-binding protein, partial [Flavobacteriia bacterium]